VHSASPMPLAPPVAMVSLPLTFIAGPFEAATCSAGQAALSAFALRP
jgi:hypothetical protein